MKPKKRLYVLIACEESQAECKAFRDLGHIAYSCDIVPCIRTGNPYWHIIEDARRFLNDGWTAFRTQAGFIRSVPNWDLIICHPPCTYLCKVGSIYMRKDADVHINISGKYEFVNSQRYEKMIQAREFFFDCLTTDAAPYVAVENPIPQAIAQLPRPSCYACPSWFGVKYTKKTLYWLRNLPPLMPTIEHSHPKEFHRSSRGKYRSRTFPKMAQAIAQQWSEYILSQMI